MHKTILYCVVRNIPIIVDTLCLFKTMAYFYSEVCENI